MLPNPTRSDQPADTRTKNCLLGKTALQQQRHENNAQLPNLCLSPLHNDVQKEKVRAELLVGFVELEEKGFMSMERMACIIKVI